MRLRGFIALISVMIIGFALLALTAAASARALFAGFDVVDAIHAEAADEAARSCAAIAELMLARDPSYEGGEEFAVGSSSCRIGAVLGDAVTVSGTSGSAEAYADAKIKDGAVRTYEEIPNEPQ
jgi:hypothetical protein